MIIATDSLVGSARSGPMARKARRSRDRDRARRGRTASLHRELQSQMAVLADAERQIITALTGLRHAAAAPQLRALVTALLAETRAQSQRLKKIAHLLGSNVQPKRCQPVRDLLKELARTGRTGHPSALRDACLAALLEQLEHYEIAAYDILSTWTRACGAREANGLCARSLAEEKLADERLEKVSAAVLLPNALWDRRYRRRSRGGRARPSAA